MFNGCFHFYLEFIVKPRLKLTSLWKSSKFDFLAYQQASCFIIFDFQLAVKLNCCCFIFPKVFHDFSSAQNCLKDHFRQPKICTLISHMVNFWRTPKTSRKRKLLLKEWIWKKRTKELNEVNTPTLNWLLFWMWFISFFCSVNLTWMWQSIPSDSQQNTCRSSSGCQVLLKALNNLQNLLDNISEIFWLLFFSVSCAYHQKTASKNCQLLDEKNFEILY